MGKGFSFLLDHKRILSPDTSVAHVLIWRKLFFFPFFFSSETMRQRKLLAGVK